MTTAPTSAYVDLRPGKAQRAYLARFVVALLDAADRSWWQPVRRLSRWAQRVIVWVLDLAEVAARPLLPRSPGRHRPAENRVPSTMIVFAVRYAVDPPRR